MTESCRRCQQSGRNWTLLDRDVYCGLCGRAIRDVEVYPASAEPGDPSGATSLAQWRPPPTPAMTWLVTARKSGESRASLVVFNTGVLPIRIASVDAPGASCQLEARDRDLQRGESAAVAVILTGLPTQFPGKLELVVHGNFPEKKLSIPTGPAPTRLAARAAGEDEWSRLIAGSPRGPGAVPLTHLVSGALRTEGSGWDLTQSPKSADPGTGAADGSTRSPELALGIDRQGRAVFEVMADRANWGGRWLPPAVKEGRWEGKDAVAVHVVAGPAPLVPGAAIPDPVPYRLSLVAGPGVTGEIAGTVVFHLDSLGAPEVRVPVRLVPGRPEWVCNFDHAPHQVITVPYGCPNVLYVTCAPMSQGPGFADRSESATLTDVLVEKIDEYRLDVTASPPSGGHPPARVRVQRLGPALPCGAAPPDLRFRVEVTPRKQPGEFELSVRLTALIGKARASLSGPRTLRVQAVDTRDPRVLDERGGYRLVVDFGTTYTCIGRADALEPRVALNQCQTLRERSGLSGRDKQHEDLIPTVLWLKETESPGDPQCLVGFDAEGQGAPSAAAGEGVFRLFKPDILDKTPHELIGPGGARRTYYAKDFAFFFLRELLAEVRAQLGHAIVRDLYITCPATFTEKQREALKSVVTRLIPYGIAGDANLLLDEANAGAFRDMEKHLTQSGDTEQVDGMILDFGGGTIDIAALHARKRPGGKRVNDLAPLGITGLRDFGGKHVTEALALHLAKRLAAHLYVAKTEKALMSMTVPPWVPLPRSVTPGIANQPPHVLEMAEENFRFLLAVAEEVKTRFYGSWPAELMKGDEIRIPSDDPKWYEKLDSRLSPAVLEKVELRDVAATFRMIDKAPSAQQTGSAAARPREREVTRAEWRRWLADCAIERKDLDAIIAPALEEAFGRARRLWNSAREAYDPAVRSAPYRPPDLLLLAGGSSQLPLVWKMAARQGDDFLGFPVNMIRFSKSEAKRKVALGGALYARVRAQEATADDVAIRPENTLRYLLIPIVYEIMARRYQRIFPTGYEVTEQGIAQPRAHHPDDQGKLELLVYEDFDYRGEPWDLTRELLDLKMKAPGKELLTELEFQFPNSDIHQVEYMVKRAGLARKLVVRPSGGNGAGFEPKEKEI